MIDLSAPDPGFAERVRKSFAAQAFMQTIGARLERVEPGEVDIALAHREDLTQQHGYLHAAVVTAIADSACGYAAYSLMPEGSEVLSIEFKTNLLRPAVGRWFGRRRFRPRRGEPGSGHVEPVTSDKIYYVKSAMRGGGGTSRREPGRLYRTSAPHQAPPSRSVP
jgi:hypothetical protein